jgi:hypothetical protein
VQDGWTARHNTSEGRTQHKDVCLLLLCNVHDQLPSITLQENSQQQWQCTRISNGLGG